MKYLKYILIVLAMAVMIPAMPVSAASYAGRVIKGSSPAVYYVTKTNKRLLFPDLATYKSWYQDFRGVITVQDWELTQLPLVGNVTMKPGIAPIKAKGANTVYAVARYGVARPFATPSAAAIVYDKNWASKVVTVSPDTLASYLHGVEIVGPDQYWWKKEMTSVKTIDDNFDTTMNGMRQISGKTVAASAQLTLRAIVVNGTDGRFNATDSDAKLFIEGASAISGKAYTVKPGDYSVYQVEVPGFVKSDWGKDCVQSSSDINAGYVHLNAGDKKTCTITYTYSPVAAQDPVITIHANVVNAHPEKGTAAPGDFTFVVGSDRVTPDAAHSFAPGWYNVKSFNHMFDYSPLGLSGDCNQDGTIELKRGHAYSCTFSWGYVKRGDFRPTMGQMVLSAMIVGGTAKPTDVRFFIEGKPVSSGQVVDVDPRDYTVYHSSLTGYKASDWQGSCNATGQVHGEVSQLKVCTVIFTKL